MNRMSRLAKIAFALLLAWIAMPAFAQATARPCVMGAPAEVPGPACLLASTRIGAMAGPVYWHIDQYPSIAAAQAARAEAATVVEAYGKVWLFTLGARESAPAGGRHVASVGPLPIAATADLTADYLRSIFSPGQTAPLHVHSGPEAFYAMSGGTCLETPDGVQKATGPDNILFIRAGPPMLLKAIGSETRRGFALILHSADQPPTTLIHDWTPKGLCD